VTGRVLTFPAARVVAFEDEPLRALAPGEVRLRTLHSGISAGTELASYRGTNPYLEKRWDAARRLFVAGDGATLAYPLRGIGYEEVGRVVEVGPDVSTIVTGELVYGTWGHRTHHVMNAGDAALRRLPEGLDPLLGIFSHIGAIALNGVHDARIRVGETVAVFGLGVPGQIVAQLAARSGARVIGVDLVPARLELAASLGAIDVAIDPREAPAAETIKALTDGRGADVVIEVSGATAALHEAVRAVAYSSTVVAMGFFQGAAHALALGEEFHHNRVTIVGSQISGVSPELSHRWNRVRLARRALELAADGTLELAPLVSHHVPFDTAAEAFAMLDEAPHAAMQVVLDFPDA
jgi:2-desacetyl-2-hydroxyethyl bacteriochlorophyllide A dehydrogenase